MVVRPPPPLSLSLAFFSEEHSPRPHCRSSVPRPLLPGQIELDVDIVRRVSVDLEAEARPGRRQRKDPGAAATRAARARDWIMGRMQV